MDFKDALLRAIDQASDLGILTTDARLVVTSWNRWLQERTHLRADDTVGRNLLELFPELGQRHLDRYYQDALAGQSVVLAQRLHEYLLPMPPTVPFAGVERMRQSVQIAPLTVHDQVIGTLTMIEDVTERVLFENELRQQAADLTEAARQKDEFLAMLAHELRNPLAPIRHATEVLRLESRTPGPGRHAREIIDRQLRQLTHLVDDLLDISRVTRGKINVTLRRIDLAAVIVGAVETSRPLLEARTQELRTQLPDSTLILNADADRLEQVLANLLNNASKYSPEGSVIELGARQEGQEAVVSVRDQGVGIPPEMLPRIFDLFTQLDRTLARAQGGLGIGLTLVRRLVEMHGGKVEAHSAGLGRGSEFIVRLPVCQEEPGKLADVESTPPNPPPPSSAPSRRVLLVDDNVDSTESLAMLLDLLGHKVETATTGNAGIEVARRQHPEIVLLDIGLPDLSGYDVARQLRGYPETANALLVALTGYGQEQDRTSSREAGFDAHLVKPVDMRALEGLLAKQRPVQSGPHAGAR